MDAHQYADAQGRPTGAEVDVTAAFDGSTISGNGGCNQYHADYEATGNEISIGPIAATQMACPAQEASRAYLALLATATLAIDGGSMTMADDGQRPVRTGLTVARHQRSQQPLDLLQRPQVLERRRRGVDRPRRPGRRERLGERQSGARPLPPRLQAVESLAGRGQARRPPGRRRRARRGPRAAARTSAASRGARDLAGPTASGASSQRPRSEDVAPGLGGERLRLGQLMRVQPSSAAVRSPRRANRSRGPGGAGDRSVRCASVAPQDDLEISRSTATGHRARPRSVP